MQRRIEHCWRPYRDALRAELDETHRRFGALWHLNVHAMTDDSYALLGLPGQPLVDFVLEDLNGTSADEVPLATIEGVRCAATASRWRAMTVRPGVQQRAAARC